MVNLLSRDNSLLNQFMAELRDHSLQKDRMRFRRNLERVGEIAAMAISKSLNYQELEIQTPLGSTPIALPVEQPVVATILRAGLPLHQGILNYFDQADNAFISAYRKHHKDGGFEIRLEYVSSPSLENRILILADPMLATGSSLISAFRSLLERGKPKHCHIVCVLASAEGIENIKKHLPAEITLWVAAIDEELTAQSYIVPGLGDAGDLAYGEKI